MNLQKAGGDEDEKNKMKYPLQINRSLLVCVKRFCVAPIQNLLKGWSTKKKQNKKKNLEEVRLGGRLTSQKKKRKTISDVLILRRKKTLPKSSAQGDETKSKMESN